MLCVCVINVCVCECASVCVMCVVHCVCHQCVCECVCECVCVGECVCVMCVVLCCVSKHITIACVQSHHLFMHVAQVQLHLASVFVVVVASTSDPQHVYEILCCWRMLSITIVLMHIDEWLFMRCHALTTFQQDRFLVVCATCMSYLCAVHVVVSCMPYLFSSRSTEDLPKPTGPI